MPGGKTAVIAGLVPAISIRRAQYSTVGMAGTSPAMTNWERLFPAANFPAAGRYGNSRLLADMARNPVYQSGASAFPI